jgi:hypothetical protein
MWAFMKVVFTASFILHLNASEAKNITVINTMVSVPEGGESHSHKNVPATPIHYTYNKSLVATTTFFPNGRLLENTGNLSDRFKSTKSVTLSELQYGNAIIQGIRQPQHLAVIAKPSYFRPPNSQANFLEERRVTLSNTTAPNSDLLPTHLIKDEDNIVPETVEPEVS